VPIPNRHCITRNIATSQDRLISVGSSAPSITTTSTGPRFLSDWLSYDHSQGLRELSDCLPAKSTPESVSLSPLTSSGRAGEVHLDRVPCTEDLGGKGGCHGSPGKAGVLRGDLRGLAACSSA